MAAEFDEQLITFAAPGRNIFVNISVMTSRKPVGIALKQFKTWRVQQKNFSLFWAIIKPSFARIPGRQF